MDNSSELTILWRGLERGLLYAPLAMYIGLVERHLKRIDVSLDASVVVSGVTAAVVLTETGSLFLALLSGTCAGSIMALTAGCFQVLLGIDFILAGIVLALIVHSLCVIWIGESFSLVGAPNIFYGTEGILPPLATAFLVAVACKVAFDSFFRTEVGLVARAVGSGESLNIKTSPNLIILITLGLCGSIVGLTGFVNVQYESLARSGGSFGRLIDALASFMIAERVVSACRIFGERLSERLRDTRKGIFGAMLLWVGSLRITTVAVAGSIVYQTLLFAIMVYSPKPELPRLVVGLILVLLLADQSRLRSLLRRRRATRTCSGTPQQEVSEQTELSDVPKGIEVRGITMVFFRRETRIEVLNNLSEQLNSGRTVLLTGYNGAGKTTLLRIIAGDLEPSAGQVLYQGEDITRTSRQKRGFYLMTQDVQDSIAADLTVAENLAISQIAAPSLFRPGLNMERLTRARMTLSDLEMDRIFDRADLGRGLDKLASTLSEGQAQLLSMAMAFLFEPRVLLADEPTSGLDPDNADNVFRLIERFSRDRLVIIVSHDRRAKDMNCCHLEMEGGALKRGDT